MKRNVNDLTSNEYYGGINRRFDRRAKLLRRLGFKREGVAYVRRHWGKDYAIPTAAVSLADKRAWIDHLKWAGVRTGYPIKIKV